MSRALHRAHADVVAMRPHLYVVDALAVFGAGLVLTAALPSRFGGLDLPPVAAAAGATLVLARMVGLYRPRLMPSVREDLPVLLLVSITAALVMSLLTDAVWMHGSGWTWHSASLAGAVLVLLVGLRAAVYRTTIALRREGVLGQRVVIVDAGPEGSRLAETLLARREFGLVPVGMISNQTGRPARGLPLPLLGGMEDLHDAMRDLGVDDVIFALPDLSDAETVATVRQCVRDERQVFVMPRSAKDAERGGTGVEPEATAVDLATRGDTEHSGADLAVSADPLDPIDPVDMVQVQRRHLRSRLQLPRRVADLVASAVALVLLAPILLPAIIALRLEVGRGVFFRQTRISRTGRPFTLLKLRTTRPAVFDAGATTWRIDNESRIGPVGRLVRSTGVDELPQLLNVLRGEMRLVDPWSSRADVVRALSR